MKTLRKYRAIYKEFFKTSFSESLSFRMDYLVQNLMKLSFLCTSFLTAGFIFNHIEAIGFWNQPEFFFFLSFVVAVDQTHHLFFSHNFWELSGSVRLGKLDFTLLKPASEFFIVFTRRLAIPIIFTTLLSYILIVYFGRETELSWIAWISLPFCLFLSVMLLFGIEVLISLFNFITIEGQGINQVRIQLQHFLRWPDFVYKNPFRLWMLPCLAITSIPVRWLLDSHYWTWLLFMILGTAGVWGGIAFFWPKAVRLYESPSS